MNLLKIHIIKIDNNELIYEDNNSEFLKKIVTTEIIELFDYKNLNIDIPYFYKLIPTVENISILIWNILRKKIDNNYFLELKLYETERNFVIYKG